MENKTVRRNLYRVLRKTGIRKEDISLEANFTDDLHFDSTDWTIFTYYFEHIFNVDVEEDQLVKAACVNDTINLLKETA